MSQLESTPPNAESPPPAEKERLPHSSYGIISFRLAAWSVLIWAALAFAPYFWKDLFLVSHAIVWLICPILSLTAFVLGIVGLCMPHTKKDYAVLGLFLSLPIILLLTWRLILTYLLRIDIFRFMKKTLHRLSRQSSVRLQAGELILRGFANEEIMEILEVSLSSVKRWRKKLEIEGLPALARHAGTGRIPKLTPEQFEELKIVISQGATAFGYLTDRWTSRIVADFIRKKWDVQYSRSQVRKILRDLGFSYQKPDVKSTKHSQEVVDDWKENDWSRIKKKRKKRV